MTNPDDVVRVRARLGGRASVYEANGWCQAYSTGLLEGTGVTQNTSADMNVLVGGSSAKPDVVIATNPSGYKIALDLVGQTTLTLTAPSSNSRISSIVAYTDDLSLTTGDATVTGSPDTCGLIVVNGDIASSPTAPNDTAIRVAITSDGGTGSQAAYCVIANVTVESSTTTITDSLIEMTAARIKVSNMTELYDGEDTGTRTPTLSDSVANYDFIRIFYRTTDNIFHSVDVYNADGKTISLTGFNSSQYTVYLKMQAYTISGTSFSTVSWSNWQIGFSTTSTSYATDNGDYIYITRVEGWNLD